jgi:hypothetical protein
MRRFPFRIATVAFFERCVTLRADIAEAVRRLGALLGEGAIVLTADDAAKVEAALDGFAEALRCIEDPVSCQHLDRIAFVCERRDRLNAARGVLS